MELGILNQDLPLLFRLLPADDLMELDGDLHRRIPIHKDAVDPQRHQADIECQQILFLNLHRLHRLLFLQQLFHRRLCRFFLKIKKDLIIVSGLVADHIRHSGAKGQDHVDRLCLPEHLGGCPLHRNIITIILTAHGFHPHSLTDFVSQGPFPVI